MNRKQTIWDEVGDGVLNVQATNLEAESSLSKGLKESDLEQENLQLGYIYLDWIVNNSIDPNARKAARSARLVFQRAEKARDKAKTHFLVAHQAVRRAWGHTVGVLQLTEEHRAVSKQTWMREKVAA